MAKEILSTEQSYVKSLGLCIRIYLEPLKEAVAQNKPIIKQDQIRAIFSDIETIHKFGQTLLSELEPIVQNWSPDQCLGKIFLQIMDFLKIYSEYVKNFSKPS